MTWSDNFTILGFEIDNQLKHLHKNFTNIHDKIKSIVRSWTPYKLSLRGRLTIAKTMMCSQLTYVSTILTPTKEQLDAIQETINNFVQDIHINKKNWINKDLMYTAAKHGGMGMVRLTDFTEAIRVSWIRRYAIECTDDHWADIIDQKLQLTKETRTELLKYGRRFGATSPRGSSSK